jgi:hypothetical protein
MRPLKPAAALFICSLSVYPQAAQAAYSASGQYCQLPDRLAPANLLATCNMQLGENSITVKLTGNRPYTVKNISFSVDGSNLPFQTIQQRAHPLIDPETVSIMLLDFNFDGWTDFAILRNFTDSKPSHYIYYLYDPTQKKFVFSRKMAVIINPVVDKANKHILSYWQKSQELSGWDIWSWKNGAPFLGTRVEQQFTRNGKCHQTTITYDSSRSGTKATGKCN